MRFHQGLMQMRRYATAVTLRQFAHTHTQTQAHTYARKGTEATVVRTLASSASPLPELTQVRATKQARAREWESEQESKRYGQGWEGARVCALVAWWILAFAIWVGGSKSVRILCVCVVSLRRLSDQHGP